MIFIINTINNGIEFLLDDKIKSIYTDKQSVALPIEAEKFLKENAARWSDLNAIGVITGPGSFTGIRLGIAYAKGLGMGLKIPVIPINAFEIYLQENPDTFVAIDSGRGDFFVAAKGLNPCTMSIDDVEVKQMNWARTVGHKPFDLHYALSIVKNKLQNNNNEPVVPMYLRPSYAEQNH